MADIILTNMFQYYLDLGDTTTPSYTRVTEDSSFDPAVDNTTYSPSYKDRVNQPEYVTGTKTTVDVNIDVMSDQDLQEWFRKHEFDINTPTKLVRVDRSSGAEGAREAIMAAFLWTGNPINGSAGEALQITGTLTMSDAAWTKGTFDEATKAFTVAEG